MGDVQPAAVSREKSKRMHVTREEYEEIMELFKQFDLDGSGQIDGRELATVMTYLDPVYWNDHRVNMLMEQADLDGDKQVDFSEFVTAFNGGAEGFVLADIEKKAEEAAEQLEKAHAKVAADDAEASTRASTAQGHELETLEEHFPAPSAEEAAPLSPCVEEPPAPAAEEPPAPSVEDAEPPAAPVEEAPPPQAEVVEETPSPEETPAPAAEPSPPEPEAPPVVEEAKPPVVETPPPVVAPPVAEPEPVAIKAPPEVVDLKVTVKSAKGLRKADWFGHSDPYCVCTVAGRKEPKPPKTQTIDETENPVWNFDYTLSKIRLDSDKLRFDVYDEDFGKSDDFLGFTEFVVTKQHYPDGFDGDLTLQEAGKGITATLQLKIAVVDP